MESIYSQPAVLQGKNYATEAGFARLDCSAIDAAQSTMNEATALVERIQSIVDRLCGAYQPTPSPSDLEKLSSGVLPSLKDRSERTADAIRRAHSALDRLDKSI